MLLAIVRTWRRDPQFRTLTILVVVLLVGGSAFYYLVEGWSVVDAFYFCVFTLATVGFGDLAPVTTLGKIFTTFYIFAGVSLIAGFINTVSKETWSRGKDEDAGKDDEDEHGGKALTNFRELRNGEVLRIAGRFAPIGSYIKRGRKEASTYVIRRKQGDRLEHRRSAQLP
jgi:hypothetical protein